MDENSKGNSSVGISDQELANLIKEQGANLGFSLVGITAAARPDTLDFFRDWLQQGYHGEMNYLERREDAYADQSGVMIGVRSIVVVAMNYGPGRPTIPGHGRVAAYAQGTADYHDLMRTRLKKLAAVIRESRPESHSRVTVDTAPLLERDLAKRAGLGWFGKNTMLINKHAGSYFFLGGILTNTPLPPDPEHVSSHCGTCTRCLDACPTDAFVGPHVLDARKCIAYLTIELRGEPIPRELRSGVEDWMFGCDVCQQVCPWNRKAAPASEPQFQPIAATQRSALEFLELDEQTFRSELEKTPLSRPGAANMARNAAIVLGNSRMPESVPVLIRTLNHNDPVVRATVAWALGNIGTQAARESLLERFSMEADEMVREEIQTALRRP
ncbi:tRNA epoxyqueuosine(34) reductase QueG [Planctomicrobium sp. SH527]|uniref:tRNA epoxyqueuosine(34) reductase QueG n=1 Tax=Planctomicrobium sp. SH527 TaxID=3448123 RepID=UPI003F5B20F9